MDATPFPTDAQIQEARELLDTMLPANLANETERSAAVVGLAGWLSDRDRRQIGGNQPPETIAPESLLRLDPAEIPDLLAGSFQPLVERAGELLGSATAWQEDRGRTPLEDQQAADDLTDLLQQVMLLAHMKTGEVETARRPIKLPIYEAGQKIDGFFNSLRNRLLEIAGQEPYRAGPTTMQGRLNAWVRAKAEREAAERAAEAARLKAEADAKLAAARAPDADDDAVIEAAVAEETAADAARAAAAPARDMARSTTARGTTLGLRANWTFEVADFDLLVLAAAKPAVIGRLMAVPALREFHDQIERALTIAGGPVPLDYLAPNDPVIRAAVKGERGRRECPGLKIFNDAQASRRGA